MGKLEALTPEQTALMAIVRDEWIQAALGGDTRIDTANLRPRIDWVYSLAKLSPPTYLVVVDSPFGAQLAANLLPEVINRLRLPDPESAVGSAVDSAVDSAVHSAGIKRYDFGYVGIGWYAGWTAFYDYFTRIGVLKHDKFNSYTELIRSGVWDTILLQDAAIVCRRPKVVRKDEQGRLHNPTGPAVEWADTWSNYFVHGVRVDNPDWILTPAVLTVPRILAEPNIEVRRCMVDTMGKDRFAQESHAVVVDTDRDVSDMPRRLLRIDMPQDEPIMLVEVQCPSTGKIAHLRVPPTMERCSQAVAWTFGLTVSDYAPMVEA